MIFFAFQLWSQESIERTEENRMLLENLIKEKIDSVRLRKKLTVLETDSSLYKASKHHSDYQRDKKTMSHTETNRSLKTPQDRVNYFGAKDIYVGENVLFTDFNDIVSSTKGKKFDCSNIENLANLIVILWLESPPHLKNITNKVYTLTGVSISFDKKSDWLYATQVFGFKREF